jgi:hypothetical protein
VSKVLINNVSVKQIQTVILMVATKTVIIQGEFDYLQT